MAPEAKAMKRAGEQRRPARENGTGISGHLSGKTVDFVKKKEKKRAHGEFDGL